MSALVANMRQGGYAQGGSTLTQQLARAIFLSPRKTLSRKVNEALVSFEIERLLCRCEAAEHGQHRPQPH